MNDEARGGGATGAGAPDRQRLVEEFRAFVESTAAAPPAPARVDLATLLGELAALKREVHLGAREHRRALDELRALATTLEGENQRLREALEDTTRRAARAARDAERPLLVELLELRDRLEAASQSIRGHRPLPIDRFTGASDRYLRALGEGMEITLRRLDEVLARNGVRALEAEGRPFDPHTMHAAEVGHDPERPDGVVLAELRRGFARGEELLRAAEVLANRAAAGDAPGEGDGDREQSGATR